MPDNHDTPLSQTARMERQRSTVSADIAEEANNNGFRASTYWVLARGLAADITDAAWCDPESPLRTPGLDALLRGVAHEVRSCHAAVTDAYLLADDDLPDSETMLALEMAGIRAAQAQQQVAVLTRRVAQLGLGICEYLDPEAEATDRLRQACTAVLYMYPFEPYTIVDDGIAMASLTATELVYELSGLVARMTLEGDTCIHVYAHSIHDSVRQGPLRLRVTADDTALRVGTNLGHDRTWPDQEGILEPVRYIVDTIVDHLGNDGVDLRGVRFSLI